MTLVLNNLVDGSFLEASDGSRMPIRNPANPNVIVGTVPAMTDGDVARVYDAASRGYKGWRDAGSLQRGRVLLTAAAIIRSRQDELAKLIVSEMGKTLREAQGEVGKTAEFFEYYGGMGRDEFGQLLPDARTGTFAARIVEPIGVVLLITPWNDPLLTPARKLAPALIAGNAVVLKPAPAAPLISLELASILAQAGLPAGVLGTVTGDISSIGDALLNAEHLNAMSFTGSTSVGKDLRVRLTRRGIRVQTEMGGKNAALVMNDADLDTTIPTLIAGAFAQSGQRCTATSRLIVQSQVADEVRERLKASVTNLRVGPGIDETVDLGPVIDIPAQKRIQAQIAQATEEGAQLLAEGGLVSFADENGSFVRPALLNVNVRQDIWRKEVFGPVLGMTVVQTLEEGINLVNDSAYGLSSSIFTKSLADAFTFVNGADTGQVSVNQPTSGWDIHHPFGGFKDSGSDFKEQGHDALAFYTRIKAAAIRTR